MSMNIPKKEELKLIMLHNFSNKEISLIMSQVKALYPESSERKKLIFSKSTETSKTMTVEELIDDVSGDHLYLLENPPTKSKNEQ